MVDQLLVVGGELVVGGYIEICNDRISYAVPASSGMEGSVKPFAGSLWPWGVLVDELRAAGQALVDACGRGGAYYRSPSVSVATMRYFCLSLLFVFSASTVFCTSCLASVSRVVHSSDSSVSLSPAGSTPDAGNTFTSRLYVPIRMMAWSRFGPTPCMGDVSIGQWWWEIEMVQLLKNRI